MALSATQEVLLSMEINRTPMFQQMDYLRIKGTMVTMIPVKTTTVI